MILEVRMTRKMVIEKCFEKEKSRMSKYYVDKSKKNKKFKTIFKQLTNLKEDFKHVLLRNYYDNMMVSQNTREAIYACVRLAVKKGKRAPEVVDCVTEEEHK